MSDLLDIHDLKIKTTLLYPIFGAENQQVAAQLPDLLTADSTRVSTDVAIDYQWSIDKVSAKYRRNVGEVSARYQWTKKNIGRHTPRPIYRQTYDWVLTNIWLTIDWLSADCQPTLDRLSIKSTETRPTYRPMCRPRVPKVNMIRIF